MRRAILLVLLGSLFSFESHSEAFAENLNALVIGNSNYANADPLPNPVNDATAVSRKRTFACAAISIAVG